VTLYYWEDCNRRLRCPPREYLDEYTSPGKPKIPPAERIREEDCTVIHYNFYMYRNTDFWTSYVSVIIVQLYIYSKAHCTLVFIKEQSAYW